jgi:hypothetical protein
LLNSHPGYPAPKVFPENTIPISQQIPWCRLKGEGFDYLLCGPLRRGLVGYIEMKNRATLVGQHDEDIEDTKGGCGYRKEINGDQVGEVIIEKGPPRL